MTTCLHRGSQLPDGDGSLHWCGIFQICSTRPNRNGIPCCDRCGNHRQPITVPPGILPPPAAPSSPGARTRNRSGGTVGLTTKTQPDNGECSR